MKQNNFRDIFTVAKFTFSEIIQRKSFRISIIIVSALLVLGFNVPNIINSLGGDAFSRTVLVSDSQNIFAGQLSALAQANPDPTTKYENTTDDLETIKAKIESGEASAAIVVDRNSDGMQVRYLVDNIATTTEIPQDIVERLQLLYTNVQISKLNLTNSQLASLTPNFEFSVEQVSDQEVGGNIFVAMMASCILFFAVYICSYQVSSSIAVEKTSKIMETLVTSTNPRSIVLGKTIGIGLAGLLQIIVYLIVAIFSAYIFLDLEMLNALLDFSNLTPMLIVILIIYFILGYFMYALLYALTGSTISKPEEIQSANTPVVIITLVGFYLAYFTLTDPTSSLNSLAALLPISSPFCMPLRVMMGVATTGEILTSIIILIVACVIVAHVAIKIYSNAILRYGTKLSWKDIIKSYKEQ